MSLFENEPFVDTSLSGNVVQTTYYDSSREILWIGTYQGLNALDLATQQFTAYRRDPENPQTLNHDVVVSIFRDSKNRLWVGTLGGLHRFHDESGTFTQYPTGPEPGQISHPTIRDIHEDRGGRLWIVSNGGVYRYDETRDAFVLVIGIKAGNYTSDFGMVAQEDPNGLLYFGFWDGGVVLYDPEADRILENLLPQDLRIYSMLLDREGYLWVGTWGGGLFCLDPGAKEFSQSLQQRGVRGSLPGNIIYSLFEDRTGMIWVGTHGNGLGLYNPTSRIFSHMTHNPADGQSIASGSVTTIFKDSKNRYWVGTYNGGLNLFEEFDGAVQRFAYDQNQTSSISNNIIRQIVEAPDGNIWVATNDGLNRYNEDGTFTRFEAPDTTIMSILPREEPGTFWLGTYSKGVVAWGPETGLTQTLSLGDSLVYNLTRDDKKRLWIGTNRGLYLYNPTNPDTIQGLQKDGTLEGLAGQTVRTQYLDSEGRMWIGTIEGGVTVISPDFTILHHYGKEEGLVSYNVSALVRDSEGAVWASTNSGMNRLSYPSGVTLSLGREQGLPYDEFSTGVLRDTDGYLLLGNVDGLTRFDPNLVREQTRSFPPTITRVFVQNQERELSFLGEEIPEVWVPWSQNSILLEFAGLDFSGSRTDRFFYALEGFDRDWVDGTNRRQAGYTNLSPGTYTFYLSWDSDMSFTDVPRESRVLVRVEAPPFFQPWAFILYSLLTVAFIYGITQIRLKFALADQVQQLTKTQEALEIANKKLNYMSYHDQLSGLGNRRMFSDTLSREWMHCRRSEEPISLISLDIDFFKPYNDTLGHPAGDEVIRQVSQVLTDSVSRGGDLVCRIGGEEFALVLPATTAEGAIQIASTIQAGLAFRQISHPASSLGPFLTVSIGIETLVPKNEDIQVLVNASDDALYAAKNQGRNRIVHASLES